MVSELWAAVYRPRVPSDDRHSLIIFLHGNHATCGTGSEPRLDFNTQYTFYGTCPLDFVVVPNHAGYAYMADRLASWGYIVVSINANRGVNAAPGMFGDAGLNLVRGRLVLRHLQRLSEWNTVGGTPESLGVELQGKLDFEHVGLMGHSRGGEGMRAAYNLYRDPDSPWPALIPDRITLRAIFEIGAVDGQTARVLDAEGTVWNQLLPMCDGDVSNLQGILPLERMMLAFSESPSTQKSNWTVWGTNHNFYNSEWQVSDSGLCRGHSPIWPFPPYFQSEEQQQIAMAGVMAIMRGNVGRAADPRFNRNFNPEFGLPAVVASLTRIDRGYTDSPNAEVTRLFEDFEQPTGTNSYGFPNTHSNIQISHAGVPRHHPFQRAGNISWMAASAATFFQANWSAPGEGLDTTAFQTLDLRVSRMDSPQNPAGPTNFSLRLVDAAGTLSVPVQLASYTDLRGPVGGPPAILHPILQTARIPLRVFAGVDRTQIRAVRLTFDDTPTGAIFVANIRLSTRTGLGGDVEDPPEKPTEPALACVQPSRSAK